MKKDLGIFLCPNLDFHYHIEAVCCRALKMLGFVIRTSKEFRLSSSLKALYCSLVRPILEYSSILWDPFTAADSSCIERVQRRFCSSASFILQIPHPPHDYRPVMNKLGLLSLADRRVDANLVFLHKLIDGRVDAPSLLSLIYFKVPSRLIRSNSPFVVPFHSTNYGRNNPIHRMMRICNEHLCFS